MMAKRLTNRSTKAEILAAYEALVQEKKQVESELKQSRRSPIPEPAPVPPARPSSTMQPRGH